jgi:hypothetical protein
MGHHMQHDPFRASRNVIGREVTALPGPSAFISVSSGAE